MLHTPSLWTVPSTNTACTISVNSVQHKHCMHHLCEQCPALTMHAPPLWTVPSTNVKCSSCSNRPKAAAGQFHQLNCQWRQLDFKLEIKSTGHFKTKSFYFFFFTTGYISSHQCWQGIKNDFPHFLLSPQLSDKLNFSEDCYFRAGAEKQKGWADGGGGGGMFLVLPFPQVG